MSAKAIVLLVKIAGALIAICLGGSLWYYTIGRKPTIVLSAPIPTGNSPSTSHAIAPGETVLITGGRVTLYDTAKGQQKWAVDLGEDAAPAPEPRIGAVSRPLQAAASLAAPPSAKAGAASMPAKGKPAQAPPPAVANAAQEKPDLLIAKRVERRFANLQIWANKLAVKRTTLKTKIQIEAFNEEAAKYHTELASAKVEAATLHGAPPPAPAAPQKQVALVEREESAPAVRWEAPEWRRKSASFADGNRIWVLHGSHLTALDSADGHTLRDIPLGGPFETLFRGPGCNYVLTASSDGHRQITKIVPGSDAPTSISVAANPAEPRFTGGGSGAPATPNVQGDRTEFSAAGGELAQVDIHCFEKKITERQLISATAGSELDEADKKTTGGWGTDAATFSKALAKDAAREATGGRERVDESTYEITIRRPFAATLRPTATLRVQGRPEIFSTGTLTLIAAENTLAAFGSENQKLWEMKLGMPVARTGNSLGEEEDFGDASVAVPARPCMEQDGTLYFFDQAFLGAFEVKTGKPLWRLPSIGIRKVQFDSGSIYITSANGNPDSLKFGGAGNDSIPLILRVDAKSGKILWKLEKYQNCFVSDGNLYVTRETRNSEDMVNQVFDPSKAPDCRFKLYKLSARSGEAQWEWFQTRRPMHIEAHKKQVSLLFSGELQVIKSMAL